MWGGDGQSRRSLASYNKLNVLVHVYKMAEIASWQRVVNLWAFPWIVWQGLELNGLNDNYYYYISGVQYCYQDVRNRVTCCKYVSVACELFVFVSGVQRCCQTCTKITSPPCKTHAAYICSGSARLKDLRQRCGMRVTEVRVFSRLRQEFVLPWGVRGPDMRAAVL
jgi:hypothetical protein